MVEALGDEVYGCDHGGGPVNAPQQKTPLFDHRRQLRAAFGHVQHPSQSRS
jgi:hypothetical protein